MRDIAKRSLLAAGVALTVLVTAGISQAATPLPANKPLITDVALPVAPSAFIPVPAKKPDFSTPDVTTLLSFGQAPVPRKKPMGAPGSPLTAADALIYKKIFAYQADANWAKADELLAQLGDFRLRGHILYQRFLHPTAYRASFEELAGWMNSYADYPGAADIYKLALKRKPAGFGGEIAKPVAGAKINGYLPVLSERDKAFHPDKKRNKQERAQIEALEKAVRKDIDNNAPTKAYKKLSGDATGKLLDPAEYDGLRAQIANSYLMLGKYGQAQDLARDSARRSGDKVPQAGWVAGLTAWQQRDFKRAAQMFEMTARSPYASDWTAAAGAYWASRAHMRAGNIREASPWLREAASHPRTFYGLIATRALGWDFDFNWQMPDYTGERAALLEKYPAARRAALLVEAGQYYLAEKELRQIDAQSDPALTEALLAYANRVGLPSYAMRLAASTAAPDGRVYDAALYPLLPWTPQSGYKVDRALIHALIRQESKFNPVAESRSGAMGLMQLMPATATFVSGRRDYRSREGRYNLKDPQLNLDIGQRYVENLLGEDHVDAELFSLVIAYNAGPGNLKKWKEEFARMADDPLLFIESIPLGETRAFVERVMANYWIYRLRMEQETPSLDAVAEGGWAQYTAQDDVEEAKALTPAEAYRIADSSP